MPTEPTRAGQKVPSPSRPPVEAVEYGLAPVGSPAILSSFPAGRPQVSDADAAARARAEADRGDVLFRRGQFRPALDRYREAIRLQPFFAEFHYKLASAAWRAGERDLVEPHFIRATQLDPQYAAPHEGLAQWSLQSGQMERALDESAAAVALRPVDADYRITRALVLAGDRQEGAAWEILSPLVASGLATARIARAYAQIAHRLGHETQALALIDAAMRGFGLMPGEKPGLHYAAAGLLDQVGRYDEAFEHAVRANEAARRPYNPDANTQWMNRRINYYTAEKLACLPRATHANRRPVLIVGMPRSGTSLVEQILASHPAVHGAGELSLLSEVARTGAQSDWAQGSPFPECYDYLSIHTANRLGARYLGAIDALDSSATYVTDKMPLNFLFLGTAQLLLPQCHVIHCVRDPRDTCISCYFTDFGAGQEFSFDLNHLAGYYREYLMLMEHWKKVLSLPILDLQYEAMVAEPEAQTRRLLDFLNLPWDDRCLNFHKNERHVATASREQVRRPVYNTSVGRWKHYEKHLGPLRGLVAPTGD